MDGPTAATDGGVEVLDAEAREERLQDKWGEAEWEDAYGNTRSCGGAEAAVVVGETLQRSSRRADIERELERDPEATPLAVVARLGLPPDCRELVAEVKAGVGPSGGGLREGERESAGWSLSGKSLELGGGCDWCPACHTEEPESESCPHPEYEEHPLVEGREDADVEVTTGNGGYRGNGHIPFVYGSAPAHDGEPVSFDERAPSWHVKSVTVEGEERPASAGNCIEMVEVTPEVLELPESVTLRGGAEDLVFECEECGFVSSAVCHMRCDVSGAHRGGNSPCGRER
jgi:hypothetical protein